MAQKVLVAYSSKHGSTIGIAEKIGTVLRDRGRWVEVRDVAGVGDPSGYDAVVLGSAVYVGGWRRDASRFLERHQHALASIPTWIFSSGPTGELEAEEALKGWEFPDGLRAELEVVQPRDTVVFHGALHPETLGTIERLIVRGVGAEMGDFRDFAAIGAWANEIADELDRTETRSPSHAV